MNETINLEELEKILSALNTEKICETLVERGFRLANPNYVWEYEPSLFWDVEPDGTVERKDSEGNFKYVAKLYTKIKGYEGIAFVDLVVWKLYKKQKCPMTPRKILLYTDAPIDEKYEREQESPTECALCKKTYKKKQLEEWFGRLLCERCLAITALMEARKR